MMSHSNSDMARDSFAVPMQDSYPQWKEHSYCYSGVNHAYHMQPRVSLYQSTLSICEATPLTKLDDQISFQDDYSMSESPHLIPWVDYIRLSSLPYRDSDPRRSFSECTKLYERRSSVHDHEEHFLPLSIPLSPISSISPPLHPSQSLQRHFLLHNTLPVTPPASHDNYLHKVSPAHPQSSIESPSGHSNIPSRGNGNGRRSFSPSGMHSDDLIDSEAVDDLCMYLPLQSNDVDLSFSRMGPRNSVLDEEMGRQREREEGKKAEIEGRLSQRRSSFSFDNRDVPRLCDVQSRISLVTRQLQRQENHRQFSETTLYTPRMSSVVSDSSLHSHNSKDEAVHREKKNRERRSERIHKEEDSRSLLEEIVKLSSQQGESPCCEETLQIKKKFLRGIQSYLNENSSRSRSPDEINSFSPSPPLSPPLSKIENLEMNSPKKSFGCSSRDKEISPLLDQQLEFLFPIEKAERQ